MSLEKELAAATERYKAALAEFDVATTVVIEGIRAGKRVTKAQFEREAIARNELLAARKLVTRLTR
jgi:hypothetical protein